MQLLHMYECNTTWIETPAIHPKRAYVYWLAEVLEEHVGIGIMDNRTKVPIGTNPFKKGSQTPFSYIEVIMQITYVVDTSVDEDRTYLEFWYKGTIYKISHNEYLYAVQDCDLKEWEQENIEVACLQVSKLTKDQ